MKRQCLHCGRLVDRGSYCLAHDRGTGSATRWASIRRKVLVRDGNQCVVTDNQGRRCPEVTDLEIDHIVPLAEGGTDQVSNLRTLCHNHHRDRQRTT